MKRAVDLAEESRVDALMYASSPRAVFVFGSNTAGKHGGGAARVAWTRFGAAWGIGEGPTGRSYAIPTMTFEDDDRLRALELSEIARAVAEFIEHANKYGHLIFAVTRIGCGIAGFSDAEIAPLFTNAPPNCALPDGWRQIIDAHAPVSVADR